MILTIVAIGATVFLVLGYVAFVVIRSKIRKVIGGIKSFGRLARRIHLSKKTTLQWRDPEKVRALVNPLLGRRFKDAGLFEVPEMPALYLQALVNEDNHAFGAVYEFPKRGVWLDLVFRFEDGGGLDLHNQPRAAAQKSSGLSKDPSGRARLDQAI